jgi:hypothetical protein
LENNDTGDSQFSASVTRISQQSFAPKSEYFALPAPSDTANAMAESFFQETAKKRS